MFTENLDFYLQDQAFDKQKDVVIINSKGFGGNNATASVASENLTMSLIGKRYSKADISKWKAKRESILENREVERNKAINGSIEPIYEFDKDVLDLADLEVKKNQQTIFFQNLVRNKLTKGLTVVEVSKTSQLVSNHIGGPS